jgi:NAD(P)-dependent dehydrogenase (short-subunit alcohol dehydrogenase family)
MTDLQPLDGPLARLQAEGLKAQAICGDVSSEAFAQALADRVEADYGAADVLVNNAGISLISPAEETSLAQWQRVMAINLQGPFLLSQALGKQMLARRSGNIVNVASVAGLGGVIHRSAYNASKHGLIGLTRTLAAEWGGRGVRVNAVCPGLIETGMTKPIFDNARARGNEDKIGQLNPMGRYGEPEEIANMVLFLASDESRYITGENISISGGGLSHQPHYADLMDFMAQAMK